MVMNTFIPIEDMPPSMQTIALGVREQMLNQLTQMQQKQEQNEELRRRMELKMKRRIRKAQKRGR